MEDALVLTAFVREKKQDSRLNPCCNGRCTRTNGYYPGQKFNATGVLILVVMEDALVRAVHISITLPLNGS